MAHTTQAEIGAVVSLWCYPVKSMIGEELQTAQVTDHGLLGDRAYALVDRADGKVATAKNPGKWPTLFACRATFLESPRSGVPLPPIRITLPDGTVVTSKQRDCNAATLHGAHASGRPRRHGARPGDRRAAVTRAILDGEV